VSNVIIPQCLNNVYLNYDCWCNNSIKHPGDLCELNNDIRQCNNWSFNWGSSCYCGNAFLLSHSGACINNNVIPQCPIGTISNFDCLCGHSINKAGNYCNPYANNYS